MKKTLFASVGVLTLLIAGCSTSEAAKLTQEDIEDLSKNEQVDAIIDNLDMIDKYQTFIEGNSIAIQYTQDEMTDEYLILKDTENGFPNVAMTLADHLDILEYDELVITSYNENSDTGIMLVSALFSSEGVDYERWKDVKEDSTANFYTRYTDGYNIQGMVWDDLTEDSKESLMSDTKGETGTDFWEYYGNIIE